MLTDEQRKAAHKAYNDWLLGGDLDPDEFMFAAGIAYAQTWRSMTPLPEDETPVLILHKGTPRVAALFWETPGFEETYPAYRYWDDPENVGQEFDWADVTGWLPLPPTEAK